MRRIRGLVQHYPWGDEHLIPELLGQPTDGRPWAELWFGTHPNGPSLVDDGGTWRPLRDVAGELPYLLKVVAAAEPLSLQVHPDAARAEAGYRRELMLGIPAGDPRRMYPDPHPKPELLCALTPFEAVCGFRPIDEVLADLDGLGPAAEPLRAHVAGGGPASALEWLLEDRPELGALVAACRTATGAHPAWVVRLAQRYPDDPAVLAVLLLHHVRLEPGDALHLVAGTLHAYLGGAGIEVMGSSDNVLRAGLTSKHVDRSEVLAVVHTEPAPVPVVRPQAVDGLGARFPVDQAEFGLWRIDVNGTLTLRADGPELWLCVDGDVVELPRGAAAYAAPGEAITVSGRGTCYRVTRGTA